jgi:hypothetical protein
MTPHRGHGKVCDPRYTPYGHGGTFFSKLSSATIAEPAWTKHWPQQPPTASQFGQILRCQVGYGIPQTQTGMACEKPRHDRHSAGTSCGNCPGPSRYTATRSVHGRGYCGSRYRRQQPSGGDDRGTKVNGLRAQNCLAKSEVRIAPPIIVGPGVPPMDTPCVGIIKRRRSPRQGPSSLYRGHKIAHGL